MMSSLLLKSRIYAIRLNYATRRESLLYRRNYSGSAENKETTSKPEIPKKSQNQVVKASDVYFDEVRVELERGLAAATSAFVTLMSRIPFQSPPRKAGLHGTAIKLSDSGTSKNKEKALRKPGDLDTSFEDHVSSFRPKTNWELLRGLIVYEICSVDYIVKNNKAITRRIRSLCGDTIFALLMKLTFYGHFVAGEDEFTIQPLLKRYASFGVQPILDFSIEEDLSEETAKNLEKKALKPEKDTIKHDKQFQFSEKFADRRYKVNTARVYFYKNEATCERNMEFFLRCMEAVSPRGGDDGGVSGITAIKLTALGRPQLLLQLSEVILRTRKYVNDLMGGSGTVISHHIKKDDLVNKMSQANIQDKEALQGFLDEIQEDSEGIIHVFPWSGIMNDAHQLNATFKVPDLKTGKMVPLISQLSDTETEMFENMIRRFDTIIKAAHVMGARVMVDAEQTYFQPAISRFTLEFMQKYNKDRNIVYNTYQTYLRQVYDVIKGDLEQARRQNFCFGAKLVRGAYLEQERERAAALGYKDPTNPNYDATTKMFHDSIELCLKEYIRYKEDGKKNRVQTMVASHNEDTTKFGIMKMKEYGIRADEGAVSFAQLVGMCDYITFPLGSAGYDTYKYVPYGPVLQVLPYLSRRAQENTGILKKVKKEKRMLRKAILHRLSRGQLMYTPKAS